MRDFSIMWGRIEQISNHERIARELESYFREAKPHDAAWALTLMTRPIASRLVTGETLLEWAAELGNTPLWMANECVDATGDPAEAAALITEGSGSIKEIPLHEAMEWCLGEGGDAAGSTLKSRVLQLWQRLTSRERVLLNSVLTGSSRIRRFRREVVYALSRAFGLEVHLIAVRLAKFGSPSVSSFERLVDRHVSENEPVVFPMIGTVPWQSASDAEFDSGVWRIDPFPRGVRCQLGVRSGGAFLSAGEGESLNGSFPEIVEAARLLSARTSMDGMILVSNGGALMGGARLEERLGTSKPSRALLRDNPVKFVVLDAPFVAGIDIREVPLAERFASLQSMLSCFGSTMPIEGSRAVDMVPSMFSRWASSHFRSGLLLRRLDSCYRQGAWAEWRPPMHRIRVAVLYAEREAFQCHFTCSVGVWDADSSALLPVGKVPVRLSEEEQVHFSDAIASLLKERHGPVLVLRPGIVLEIEFEDLERTSKRKSGLVVSGIKSAAWVRNCSVNKVESVLGLCKLLEANRM